MNKKSWRHFWEKEKRIEKELEGKIQKEIDKSLKAEREIIKNIRKNKFPHVEIIFSFVVILMMIGYSFWNNEILKEETNLKFGFVTDLEYGYKDKIGNKLTNKAPEELEKMGDYFNNQFHPEIVIIGGDMVESSLSKKGTTIEQFKELKIIFSKLKARTDYVFGNHDLRDLNKEELRGILGMNDNHSYFDLGDWRFVLMDTNFKPDGTDFGPDYYIGGRVSEAEFNWLKIALDTKRPTILFSHHSSLPNEIDGVLSSNAKNLSNGLDLHNFLKQYKNLVLFVSGHEPGYKFQNIEGINYLIVGNLATINALGNFAFFEAKYNKYTKKAKIVIEKHGEHEQTFEIEKKIGKFSLW